MFPNWFEPSLWRKFSTAAQATFPTPLGVVVSVDVSLGSYPRLAIKGSNTVALSPGTKVYRSLVRCKTDGLVLVGDSAFRWGLPEAAAELCTECILIVRHPCIVDTGVDDGERAGYHGRPNLRIAYSLQCCIVPLNDDVRLWRLVLCVDVLRNEHWARG